MKWLKIIGRTLGLALVVAAGITWYYYCPSGATVLALGETAPVPSKGDAADDPAIWVHPTDPTLSVIFGTDKEGGIGVYDLDGAELQFLDNYSQNNVDVRSRLSLPGISPTLVASSVKKTKQVLVYEFDEATRQLKMPPKLSIPSQAIPQGLCFYKNPKSGELFVLTVGRRAKDRDQGWVEQFRLDVDDGELVATSVRWFDVGGVSEGCVADDELGYLFVSEENVGVWRYAADPAAGLDRILIDRVGWDGNLRYNCEGIAIVQGKGGTGYLIVSSQGSNDFTVYDRSGDHTYRGRFSIGNGGGIDAVTHTDGLDVTSQPLGPRFPEGMFVAQDDKDSGGRQNYKMTGWKEIREALALP